MQKQPDYGYWLNLYGTITVISYNGPLLDADETVYVRGRYDGTV